MTSPSLRRKYLPIALFALLAAGVAACSSGDSAQMAEPNFCPVGEAGALAANQLPRAYYQVLTTTGAGSRPALLSAISGSGATRVLASRR